MPSARVAGIIRGRRLHRRAMGPLRHRPGVALRRLGLVVALAVLVGLPSLVLPVPSLAPVSSVIALPSSGDGVLVAPAYVPGPQVTDLGPLPASTPVEVAV